MVVQFTPGVDSWGMIVTSKEQMFSNDDNILSYRDLEGSVYVQCVLNLGLMLKRSDGPKVDELGRLDPVTASDVWLGGKA